MHSECKLLLLVVDILLSALMYTAKFKVKGGEQTLKVQFAAVGPQESAYVRAILCCLVAIVREAELIRM